MFQHKLKKWCFNLFLGSTVVMFALFGLRAYSQNPFTFEEAKFRVVDNTRKTLFPLGSFAYLGNNTYNLTGNMGGQSIALGHDDCIDVFWQFRN